ncbi:flagellar assembly protein FliW [Paenibacillus woosongensis]|uniref:Flagellar assembly factor FliW n=1 Tax=Paenibacillus woosongensis TaxID=307580 RepID=A0AA95I8Y6_9BACL|nr:flagellar assembly protein FliW [Paenibacillus woosongensis]WHX48722.1 flagellar assembly protein FliW [Paenibacillus woosongensis]
MIVQTARFGKIEVYPDTTWDFLVPILGFEEYKNFVGIAQEDSPFEFIQSLDEENLTFVLTDPFMFYPEYEFTLEQRWRDILQIEKEDEVIVRSVVTVRSPSDITLNLKAPIIMNPKSRKAAQIILEQSEYETRHPLNKVEDQEGRHADTVEK